MPPSIRSNGDAVVDPELEKSTLLSDGAEKPEKPEKAEGADKAVDASYFGVMATCFVGLQASYVTWGFIQERMMTKPFIDDDGGSASCKDPKWENDCFPSATFLVAANRTLALLTALLLVLWKSKIKMDPSPQAPWYIYSPCSISNVLSSWAQYACLRYVSFPTQTLFKSSKVIPVMLVGVFLHKKSYPRVEYVEAVCISLGVSLFMLTEQKPKGGETDTTTVGLLILCMYVLCDSFTSQWQDKIYRAYKVDQFMMMFGVNFFSLLFTTVSLLSTGDMFVALRFIATHPASFWSVLVLSITSATGQLFIFYTIKRFGPIVFTIMMTTRQMFSMILSCIYYGHSLGFFAVIGALVVFGTLFDKSRRKLQGRK